MAYFLEKNYEDLHLSESLYDGFLKRHADLFTIKPHKPSLARKSITRDIVDI